MSVVRLSQQFVSNNLFTYENKSRVEYCDTELPGLYVEVRASNEGQGTYYIRYKDSNGKTCHQKIGRTCDIDLAEVRKKAKHLKAEIALGANPRGEANAAKAVPTLDRFYDLQFLPHIRAHKRSWRRDAECYARLRPTFGQQRLDQISRQRMQQLHVSLVEEAGLKPASADHVIKVARRMLSLAIEWQVLTGPNQLSRIKLFNADNRVDRHPDQAGLERLVTVLRTDANRPVCDIALFLLSTGSRLNEALSATWAQIDLENRIWQIPASNSKSKRIRAVPISDSALEVLERQTTKGEFEHVFINRKTRLPFTTISRVWKRLRMAAGLPDLRLHDLRHTFASLLINNGRGLAEVQQLLGHSDYSVTLRYAHLDQTTLRAATNAASLAIKGAMPAAS